MRGVLHLQRPVRAFITKPSLLNYPINRLGVRCCSSQNAGDKPISRYDVPPLESLDKDIQDQITDITEKSGFTPNVFKALAHRPQEFRAFFSFYNVLMNTEGSAGSLTKAEKELIVVATSGHNGCLYCVVSHSALHRIYSKNPTLADQVATCPDHSNMTPRERAIVEFALKVCKMTPVSDDDIAGLEEHGLSKEDAWDIGAITAFFAMSNRMANLTAMMPNDEFHLLGRVPKQKL